MLAAHVSASRESVEGVKCSSLTNIFISAAVHHLEQLNRKFDIAKTAPAQLEIALGIGVREHPGAHRASVVNKPLARGGLPHKRRGDLFKSLTE